MVKEAEQYRVSDERRREEQEIRNKADQAIYQSLRRAKESQGLVDASLIAAVNRTASMLTTALNNYDSAAAKSSLDELNNDLLEMNKAYYESKERQNGVSSNSSAAPIRTSDHNSVSHLLANTNGDIELLSEETVNGVVERTDFKDV